MTEDRGPATKDQKPWPWPMAMARRVAATLRVKYKIDFIFDSEGGRVESQAARRRAACDSTLPPCESNTKSILYLTRKGGGPPSHSNIKWILYLTRRGAATSRAMAIGHGHAPWPLVAGPWSLVISHPSSISDCPSSIIQNPAKLFQTPKTLSLQHDP